MENIQTRSRLHPLASGAAAALIVASAVAAAAIGGYLPGSKAEPQAQAHPQAPSQAQKAAAAKPRGKSPVRVASACSECGVVLGVKEETVMGKGTGVGAVAGGVAGAVIGHEMGDGSRAGTAVGAVVGGIAGHQIERSARSTKRYEISVRMQDGSVKTALSDTLPGWHAGDRVRLHDGVVKPL